MKMLMSLWRCRNKYWQGEKKQVFNVFELQKNVVTRKCCLQVTICLEDKIFPQRRITILARKLSCVEGCNACFHEAQPPSHFSCVTMVVGPSCSSFRFQTQAPPKESQYIFFWYGCRHYWLHERVKQMIGWSKPGVEVVRQKFWISPCHWAIMH